jgi:ZIP family zinc transporter
MISSGYSVLAIAVLGTVIGALMAAIFIAFIPKANVGVLIATAAGMMIGCGLVLLQECIGHLGIYHTALSFSMGAVLMYGIDVLCSRYLSVETFAFSGLKGQRALRVLITLLSFFLHSLGEGLSLGLSATESKSVSWLVALSLAIHNIPETASLVFLFKGKGVPTFYALLLSILSSAPQSLVALPSLHFFSLYMHLIEYGMGVSAGCMAYSVAMDVFPEAVLAIGPRRSVSMGLLTGSLVVVFDVYTHLNVR